MRMISLPTCPISLSRFVRMVERGGDWGECSMAKVPCPILGSQVRSAAMTEAQKRIGLLSNASRESQARTGSGPAALFLTIRCEEAPAAHAESSVVLPLPAEAETSVR